MPIRPDLRQYYRTPEAIESRRRALERAGGKFDQDGKYVGGAKCEQCGKPDRQRLIVAGLLDGQHWYDPETEKWTRCLDRTRGCFLLARPNYERSVVIILTVAHLDHDPRHNQDENRAALCQWCHLHWDKLHHKETRQTRKDAARPLLRGAA